MRFGSLFSKFGGVIASLAVVATVTGCSINSSILDSQRPELSLTESPPNFTIVVNDQFQLVPTGGDGNFTYAMTSGFGTISSTGLFTAPAFVGETVVTVSDSSGSSRPFNFHIVAAPSFSDGASVDLGFGNTFPLPVTGGAGELTYTVISGDGTVTSDGVFTAPSSSGSTIVEVTDQSGHASRITINTVPLPHVSPATATIGVNKTLTLATIDGVPGYVYSVVSGGGFFSGAVYSAVTVPGTVVVRSTDLRGNTSDAVLTIVAAPQISPPTISLAINNSTTFTATNGIAPLVYSLTSGTGSIDSSSGVYTASSSPGTDVVRVTDSTGNDSEATITINGPLSIAPVSKTLAVNNPFTFAAVGGVPPYTYSVSSGSGTVDSAGLYTAGSSAGAAVVRATDSVGNTASASVTINSALSVSVSPTTIAANGTSTASASNGVGLQRRRSVYLFESFRIRLGRSFHRNLFSGRSERNGDDSRDGFARKYGGRLGHRESDAFDFGHAHDDRGEQHVDGERVERRGSLYLFKTIGTGIGRSVDGRLHAGRFGNGRGSSDRLSRKYR